MLKTNRTFLALSAALVMAGAPAAYAQQANWDQGAGRGMQGHLDQPTQQGGGFGQQGGGQQMGHTDTSPWVERRPGHFDQRGADQQFGQQGTGQQVGQTGTGQWDQQQGGSGQQGFGQQGAGQQGTGQQLDQTGSIQQGTTQTYQFGTDGAGQTGQQDWRRQ